MLVLSIADLEIGFRDAYDHQTVSMRSPLILFENFQLRLIYYTSICRVRKSKICGDFFTIEVESTITATFLNYCCRVCDVFKRWKKSKFQLAICCILRWLLKNSQFFRQSTYRYHREAFSQVFFQCHIAFCPFTLQCIGKCFERCIIWKTIH